MTHPTTPITGEVQEKPTEADFYCAVAQYSPGYWAPIGSMSRNLETAEASARNYAASHPWKIIKVRLPLDAGN